MSVPNSVTAAVDRTLDVSTEFIAFLEEENAKLKEGDLDALYAKQHEKYEFFKAYKNCLEGLQVGRRHLHDLPTAKRDALRNNTRDLTKLIERNTQSVKIMMPINDRFMEIMREATKESSQQGYGADGRMKNAVSRYTPKSPSYRLNQTF